MKREANRHAKAAIAIAVVVAVAIFESELESNSTPSFIFRNRVKAFLMCSRPMNWDQAVGG
jgi:hypothetical protein